MKLERWSCDKCKRLSNGDIGDWYTVQASGNAVSGGVVSVYRLIQANGAAGTKDVCGEACALALVAEAMREMPR